MFVFIFIKKFIISVKKFITFVICVGIDEDDAPGESGDGAAAPDDGMPPLEGDDDDASRMEEVD